MMRILFSLVFWPVAFLWMAILCFLTIVFGLIFGYRRVHAWIPAPGFALIVKMTLGHLRIHRDPDFDPTRISVYCQNHVNLLDAHMASAAIPQAFCGLMNAWQFHIPFYGWLMFLSHGIPVHRHRRGRILEDISEAAKDRKKKGMSILTFPEGHRTRDGSVDRFRLGVFRMAQNAGYPVVPIAVTGSFQLNQKGSKLFKPFTDIDIFVGPQTDLTNLDEKGLRDAADALQRWISERVEPSKNHPDKIDGPTGTD